MFVFAKDLAKASWRHVCTLTYLQTPLPCRQEDAQHLCLCPCFSACAGNGAQQNVGCAVSEQVSRKINERLVKAHGSCPHIGPMAEQSRQKHLDRADGTVVTAITSRRCKPASASERRGYTGFVSSAAPTTGAHCKQKSVAIQSQKIRGIRTWEATRLQVCQEAWAVLKTEPDVTNDLKSAGAAGGRAGSQTPISASC